MRHEQENRQKAQQLLCPSAPPKFPDLKVFGIVAGTSETPEVAYLEQAIPYNEETFPSKDELIPTEFLRMASPCAEKQCRHFTGSSCSLAQTITEKMPIVTEALPPCPIRKDCRWFAEQKAAACRRCPQIITRTPIPGASQDPDSFLSQKLRDF